MEKGELSLQIAELPVESAELPAVVSGAARFTPEQALTQSWRTTVLDGTMAVSMVVVTPVVLGAAMLEQHSLMTAAGLGYLVLTGFWGKSAAKRGM